MRSMPPRPREPRSPAGGRIGNRLVALSSAAVLTVYAAGYLRTRSAAHRLEAAERPHVAVSEPAVTAGRTIAQALAAPPAAAARLQPPAAPGKVAAPVSRATAPALPPRPSSAPSTVSIPAVDAPAQTASAVPVASLASPAAEPTPTAAPATEAPVAAAPPPQPQYKDGTYSGWGSSRHGSIEATVVIDGGRIASAVISQCWTRYSCSWVAHLQGQVVARQSPEVDWVSGATQSVNAFYYAVVEALSKAR